MYEETVTVPRTRQGVRDLDKLGGRVLPVSGEPPRSGAVNVGDAERVVSAVAGGMLALAGLRGGLAGLAALVAGGALLFRGVTGHCSLYQALGRNTARRAGTEVVYRPG